MIIRVTFVTFQIEAFIMTLVVPPNFQHILRVLNTNIEGKTNVMFALTSIKGIGRRFEKRVMRLIIYLLCLDMLILC